MAAFYYALLTSAPAMRYNAREGALRVVVLSDFGSALHFTGGFFFSFLDKTRPLRYNIPVRSRGLRA